MPPCPPHLPLAGTPYHLGDLVSIGDFAVYRATHSEQPNRPFALKVCLGRSLAELLRQQRPNLERLRDAGRGAWDDRLVRLCDFDLDHAPPFLVCDPGTGGDLVALLSNLASRPAAVLLRTRFRADAPARRSAASAYRLGLVHGGLTPTSVRVSGTTLKLADLDTGATLAGHAARHSRIDAVPFDQLAPAEQVSLLRGAGMALYVAAAAPRRPARATPGPLQSRRDLVSTADRRPDTRFIAWLGQELRDRFSVPPVQVALIERCVGLADARKLRSYGTS